MGKNSDLPDIRVNDPRGVIEPASIRPATKAGTVPTMDIPKRDRRGRPKGSKNKPRVSVHAHTRDFPVVPVNPTETTGVISGNSGSPVVVGGSTVSSPSPGVVGSGSSDLPVIASTGTVATSAGSSPVVAGKVEDAIEAAEAAGDFKPAGTSTVVPVVVARPEKSWISEPPAQRPATEVTFDAWRLV